MKYFIFEVEIKLGFPEYKIVKAKSLSKALEFLENKYPGIDVFSLGKVNTILE